MSGEEPPIGSRDLQVRVVIFWTYEKAARVKLPDNCGIIGTSKELSLCNAESCMIGRPTHEIVALLQAWNHGDNRLLWKLAKAWLLCELGG